MVGFNLLLKDYFQYFEEVFNFWSSINEKIPNLLRPLFNQTEQLRLCSRAQIDKEFVTKFPGIKERLTRKIMIGVEEEMESLIKFQEEIQFYVDGLRSRLTALERAFPEFTLEDEDFNPVIPSADKLMENALDIWRCFHVLWIGIKFSVDSIDYYNEDSITTVSKAFTKYKDLEKELQYIFDITHYLRTSDVGK